MTNSNFRITSSALNLNPTRPPVSYDLSTVSLSNSAYPDRAYTAEPPASTAAILHAYDRVGPVQGELANGANTDDTRPTFYGTGTPGDLLHLTAFPIGGPSSIPMLLGDALVRPDGTWEFTPTSPLQDGTYEFHIGHGIDDGEAFRLSIAKGTAPLPPAPQPVVEETTVLGMRDDSGTIHNGNHTQDITPTLYGTGKPGDVLHLWATQVNPDGSLVKSFPLGDVKVGADGTWEFTAAPLPQGGQYSIQATDSHGYSTSYTLFLDSSIQPAPVHVEPTILGAYDHVGPLTGDMADGATTDDSRPTFHGTGNPGELLNLTAITTDKALILLGNALVGPDGTWEFTPRVAFEAGSYEFHIGYGLNDGEAFHLTIEPAASRPLLASSLHSTPDTDVAVVPQESAQQQSTVEVNGHKPFEANVTQEIDTSFAKPFQFQTPQDVHIIANNFVPQAPLAVEVNGAHAFAVQAPQAVEWNVQMSLDEHGNNQSGLAQVQQQGGLPQLADVLGTDAGYVQLEPRQGDYGTAQESIACVMPSYNDSHAAANHGEQLVQSSAQFDMRPTMMEELNTVHAMVM